ncbi:MAG TPA: DMT family transporter [Chitinophagaceae bacterium]|jgi:drug/metabolite transporter (DMT)-like permease|nr:DMT family transporter [Chitinophagaceae bacterium]
MAVDKRYQGIIYMLLAALGFSIMGGAAKMLKGSFGAGQLVFWRNAVGLTALAAGFIIRPPVNKGGKFHLLLFRGMMGTTALYTLLYCILHLPLGTAMTYNLTSALFIAVFSFLLFREYHGRIVLLAVLLGFAGMLLIYRPAMHYPWYYHVAGLISGVTSALAYITVNRLAGHYDSRVIVLSFIGTGVLVPTVFMIIRYAFSLPPDDVFFINWRWPVGREWLYVLWLGLAALFGQYFVTKAYGADKAGIVSAIGYANIVFSVFIGMALGDAFPDLMSLSGILCIILSGVIISLVKWRGSPR